MAHASISMSTSRVKQRAPPTGDVPIGGPSVASRGNGRRRRSRDSTSMTTSRVKRGPAVPLEVPVSAEKGQGAYRRASRGDVDAGGSIDVHRSLAADDLLPVRESYLSVAGGQH
jgi:hypothetical protein